MSRKELNFRIWRLYVPVCVVILLCTSLYGVRCYFSEMQGWQDVDRWESTVFVPAGIGFLVSTALILFTPCHKLLPGKYSSLSPGSALILAHPWLAPFLWILIPLTFSMGMAEVYISSFAGSVAHVDDFSKVANVPKAKYFFVDRQCFDLTRKVSGIGYDNRRSIFSPSILYWQAMPPCSSDVQTNATQVWVGWLSKETISALTLTAVENSSLADKYSQQMDKEVYAELLSGYRYFERWSVSEDQKGFFRILPSSTTGKIILLRPYRQPFNNRSGLWLLWFVLSILGSMAFWLWVALKGKLEDGWE